MCLIHRWKTVESLCGVTIRRVCKKCGDIEAEVSGEGWMWFGWDSCKSCGHVHDGEAIWGNKPK